MTIVSMLSRVFSFRVFAGALLALSGSTLHAGSAPRHSAQWLVPGRDPTTQTLERRKDKYFELSRLYPAKLYVTSADAVVPVKNVVAVPKGRLMVPLADQPNSVCELLRHAGSAFVCLKDTDSDGRFDTYFGTQVFNAIFVGSIGDDGGFQTLASPVTLTEVDPRTASPEMYLEVMYYGGSADQVEYTYCTRITWRDKYYPASSCTRKPRKAVGDGSGQVQIFGQKVSFANARSKPPTIQVEYSRNDFEFSSGNSFPW